ncbi:MAG: glycoside hydrolase family 3 C-terminal domain-containing protein [Bacteroidota bacterium]
MKRAINYFLAFLPLVLTLGALAQTPDFKWYDESLPFKERAQALVAAMTLDEKVSQTMDQSPAIPRLGIPEYNWWNEALHGIARNGRATVFPQSIGLGATFDTELMYEIADAISTEARAKFNTAISLGNRGKYAGLTFWSPNVNIFRDPRWGRGQETYGEDPFLSGEMGVAFVKGIQGDDPKYLKAAACGKHYLVHSGPEALRHEFDAIASPKDMQETYLPAFEALVKEGKVEGMMGAYNRVNGEPASGSARFLKTILRDQWGFDGYVVSDCGAIADLHRFHKVTKTPEESAALAINNGLNLNCGSVFKVLKKSIEQGLLEESKLDESLVQLYMTRFRLGFFDEPESNPFKDISTDVVDGSEHREIAYEAAVKSLVLLKNDNVLPLKKEIKSVYIVGPHASSEEILLGNYYGLSGETVSILDGIVSSVSVGTSVSYKMAQLPYRKNVNPIDWSTGEAKKSDVMIAVMGLSGLMEGEEGAAIASDLKGDREQIKLPQNQIDYLKKLKGKSDTPLLLIVTGGSPIAMPEVEKYADAILFVWYPGEEGGRAVADVIFGERNPSGKLPLTFPYGEEDLPPFEDYKMDGRTYKYMKVKPQYTFGYGLSYTDFQFADLQVDQSKDKIDLSISVENTGTMEGEEVVQVYVSSPLAGSQDPSSKLSAFQRVNLKSGEAKQVQFSLKKSDFEQFGEEGNRVIRKGKYKLWVGNMSPGERSEELGGVWETVMVDARKLK